MSDVDEQILALAAEGLTAPRIAETTGANLRTVQRVLAAAGRSRPVGRPATGDRDRLSFRVDANVIDVLDEVASERGSSRVTVAATVVATWAQRRRNAQRSAAATQPQRSSSAAATPKQRRRQRPSNA